VWNRRTSRALDGTPTPRRSARFTTVALARWPDGRDDIVPLFENIGFDHQILARHPLDRIATAIDQRL